MTINPSEHINRKELELIGNWYYNAPDYYDMLRLYRRGLPVEKMITHQVPLEAASDAFTRFSKGEGVKWILEPWP